MTPHRRRTLRRWRWLPTFLYLWLAGFNLAMALTKHRPLYWYSAFAWLIVAALRAAEVARRP